MKDVLDKITSWLHWGWHSANFAAGGMALAWVYSHSSAVNKASWKHRSGGCSLAIRRVVMPINLEMANSETRPVACRRHVGLVKRFHSINAEGWLLSYLFSESKSWIWGTFFPMECVYFKCNLCPYKKYRNVSIHSYHVENHQHSSVYYSCGFHLIENARNKVHVYVLKHTVYVLWL